MHKERLFFITRTCDHYAFIKRQYLMTKHRSMALSKCEWRTCSRSLHSNRHKASALTRQQILLCITFVRLRHLYLWSCYIGVFFFWFSASYMKVLMSGVSTPLAVEPLLSERSNQTLINTQEFKNQRVKHCCIFPFHIYIASFSTMLKVFK